MLVTVLGTEATVRREYTRKLVREHGNNCAVTLVGSPRLAELAEAEFKGETVSDRDIAAEIAPCFVDAGGKRTDTVVLACTHYPLLLQRLEKLAPWPVTFHRPGPGHRPPRASICSAPPAPARRQRPPARFSPRAALLRRPWPLRWPVSASPKPPPQAFDTPGLSP